MKRSNPETQGRRCDLGLGRNNPGSLHHGVGARVTIVAFRRRVGVGDPDCKHRDLRELEETPDWDTRLTIEKSHLECWLGLGGSSPLNSPAVSTVCFYLSPTSCFCFSIFTFLGGWVWGHAELTIPGLCLPVPRDHAMLGVEMGLAACKTSTVTSVLSLALYLHF